MRRPHSTYTRYLPIIEWLYIRGVPPRKIASLLGLDERTLSCRVSGWALPYAKDLHHEDVMAEACERFGDLIP